MWCVELYNLPSYVHCYHLRAGSIVYETIAWIPRQQLSLVILLLFLSLMIRLEKNALYRKSHLEMHKMILFIIPSLVSALISHQFTQLLTDRGKQNHSASTKCRSRLFSPLKAEFWKGYLEVNTVNVYSCSSFATLDIFPAEYVYVKGVGNGWLGGGVCCIKGGEGGGRYRGG